LSRVFLKNFFKIFYDFIIYFFDYAINSVKVTGQ